MKKLFLSNAIDILPFKAKSKNIYFNIRNKEDYTLKILNLLLIYENFDLKKYKGAIFNSSRKKKKKN